MNGEKDTRAPYTTIDKRLSSAVHSRENHEKHEAKACAMESGVLNTFVA